MTGDLGEKCGEGERGLGGAGAGAAAAVLVSGGWVAPVLVLVLLFSVGSGTSSLLAPSGVAPGVGVVVVRFWESALSAEGAVVDALGEAAAAVVVVVALLWQESSLATEPAGRR